MKSFAVERDAHVATVRMLAPAMGFDFFTELPHLMRELDADPDVRAIVLGGSGANFSFGLDLKDVAPLFADLGSSGATAGTRATLLAQAREWQASITPPADCPTPRLPPLQARGRGG